MPEDEIIDDGAVSTALDAPTDATDPNAQEVVPPEVDEGGEPITADGEGDEASKVSKMVPHDRLNEVIAQRETEKQARLAAEQRAQELEAEQRAAIEDYKAQVRQASLAGYSDVDLYRQHTAWAEQNGWGTVEAYQSYQAKARAIDEKAADGYLTPEEAAEQKAVQQELATSRSMLQRTQDMVRTIQQRDIDAEVTATRSEFEALGAKLPPEFEAILKLTNPADTKRVRSAVVQMLKEAKETAKLEYATNKTKASQVAQPEGRGGNPPPPANANDTSWKNTGWGSLILNGARKG